MDENPKHGRRLTSDGQPRETGPAIVSVLNVTPDSFSDGGRFAAVADAVAEGLRQVQAGAHWVDIGGESTRPGATEVEAEEECARVLPVIGDLARRLGDEAWISIDTYKSQTAAAAVAAGARVINDVSGGRLDPAILRVAAQHDVPIVLGHLRGAPRTMMDTVSFTDVVGEVIYELRERVAAARDAGCVRIWVDPGIGFGKRLRENLLLLAALPRLRRELGAPVMVGVSRKRFIGDLTGRAVNDRGYGTAAALALAVQAGVEALRVHDVAAAHDVVCVAGAIARAGSATDA